MDEVKRFLKETLDGESLQYGMNRHLVYYALLDIEQGRDAEEVVVHLLRHLLQESEAMRKEFVGRYLKEWDSTLSRLGK
jgi:heme oxygenase